jgi:hypothetical protein
MQRSGGWKFPHITVSTCSDSEVESSDYGRLLGFDATGNSDGTAGSFTPVANDIAIHDGASTGSALFDENSQNPLLNAISFRRTSDGSDGLKTMHPLVDEKENRTTTTDGTTNSCMGSPNHPPSPFGSSTNRNSHSYRTQSPLSTATLATTNNNSLNSASLVTKNHLLATTSFDSYNNNISQRNNKIGTTPLSLSSTSSPRRSSVIRLHGSEMNSPRYAGSSHWTVNLTSDMALPNPASSDSLHTVISASLSENRQTKNSTKEFLTTTNVTGIAETFDKMAHYNDNTTNSFHDKSDDILADKSAAAELFHSLGANTTVEANVDDIAKKYKWAYEVWSRRGLMTQRECIAQATSKVSRQPRRDVTNILLKQKEAKNSHQTSMSHSRSKDMKPWDVDRTGSFSNILDKWKSKTDEQPFDSPGSCTVMRQASFKQQQQPQKRYGVNVHDTLPSSPNGKSNVKHTDTELAKPKWNAASDSKYSPASTISKHSARHPASSLPIKELKVDSIADGSLSPIPKSQAWKLKTRHLSMQNSAEKSIHKRASSNLTIDTCNSLTSESCEKGDHNNRSKSFPRGPTQTIESADVAGLTRVASTTGIPCVVEETSVEVSASRTSNISYGGSEGDL